MRESYRKSSVMTREELAEHGIDLPEGEEDPIEALARMGAKLVLMSYLEAEVTEFLGAAPYERTPGRRGSRNGTRTRGVSCGVGTVQIDYPKVRDTERPFSSQVLEAWQRKSRTLASTLPSLYVEGLSTRDFKRALSPLWKGTGLSRSSVSRANLEIKEAFEKWRRRSLAQEEVVYLYLDGHYQGVRRGSSEKEAVLVAHGVTKGGQQVLLGVYLGAHETTEGWKLALQDLVERELRAPRLVISDGNAGLIRAVKETWPQVARQRCIVHRIRNVLARVPKKDQPLLRRELNRIFYAPSLEEALQAAEAFARRYQNTFTGAVEVLGKDLSDCLSFFRFPPRHWRRLRTSNALERQFREVRRRTRVIGRFPTEKSALSLIWSVLDQDAPKWRGILMDQEHLVLLEAAVVSLSREPIVVKGFEELLAA